MSATSIEWTDVVWNPIRGCSRVSEGCRHCYAERMAGRLAAMGQKGYQGLTKRVGGVGTEARWTGVVRFDEEVLALPLRWKKPRRVFVNSMSDLFHEKVRDGWVMRILNVMAQTHHTYQILTKRPERMRSFFARWADLTGEDFGEFRNANGPEEARRVHPSPRGQLFAAMLEAMGKPPKGCAYPSFDWMEGMIRWPATFRNVHLGVSVEDQATADERIPLLLATPAAVRWVSYEPAIGPVDFSYYYRPNVPCYCGARPCYCGGPVQARPDWIVVGGESGAGARPFDLAWARSVIAQGRAAGVPVFVKQLGARPYIANLPKEMRLRPRPIDVDLEPGAGGFLRLGDRKGGDWNEWPEDLRVREFPRA